jgi:hypothetical protein
VKKLLVGRGLQARDFSSPFFTRRGGFRITTTRGWTMKIFLLQYHAPQEFEKFQSPPTRAED